ncbi:MAG: class I adenylate-forming enzyme family protein, partial [Thermoanaerobaculia bacterium]
MSLSSSLPAALAASVDRHPDRTVRLFDRRGRSLGRRTQPEVLASARDTAARLSRLGVGEGDRVVVSLPTSWEWFDAWLGAVLAGALPLAAPSGGGVAAKGSHAARVAQIAHQVRAETLVCGAGLKAELEELETPFSAFTPEELASSPPPPRFREARPDPRAIAYLQMTSGSTGVPRAV